MRYWSIIAFVFFGSMALAACSKNSNEWQTIVMRYNEDVKELEEDRIFYSFKIDDNAKVNSNSYSRLAGFTFNPTDLRKNTAEIGVKWNGQKYDIVAYYIVDCQLTVEKLIEVGPEWFDMYIKHDYINRYALIQANGKAVEIEYTTDLFQAQEVEPSLRRSDENGFTVYKK